MFCQAGNPCTRPIAGFSEDCGPTTPRTIGTAIVIISIARAPKGRMPPTEKLKS